MKYSHNESTDPCRVELFSTVAAISELSVDLLSNTIKIDSSPNELDTLLLAQQSREQHAVRVDREAYIASLLGLCMDHSRRNLGLHMLGGVGGRQWGIIDQALADIDDMIAVKFGKVGGFVFDKFIDQTVILNTNVPSTEEMTIIFLTPDPKTSLVKGQIDETGETFDRGTLCAMCGDTAKEAAFIADIDQRFKTVKTYLQAMIV